MPRVPDHLCEHAIFLLLGGMRIADVARAIDFKVHNVRHLRQCYRETNKTADHPCSVKPFVTMCPPDMFENLCLGGRGGNISPQELANLFYTCICS